MSNFEGLAEGTPVWLPDGTVAPVERVVTEERAVPAFDKEWDLREAKLGRPYPPRDSTVGNLVPVVPVRWNSNGRQPVFAVRLASGRLIEATGSHRWAMRSRAGSRRPTWKATTELVPGCALPAPLVADFFGTLGDEWDGWFVGSMLGDGNMTGRTPTWAGHDDGTLQQMRDYAAKHGCQVRVEDNGTWLRVRLTEPEWHRNALRDLLVEHQVWGLKGEGKRAAGLPYSRVPSSVALQPDCSTAMARWGRVTSSLPISRRASCASSLMCCFGLVSRAISAVRRTITVRSRCGGFVWLMGVPSSD